MNSYPPELLAQLAPIMFVAGLDPSSYASSPSPSPASPLQSPASPQTPRTPHSAQDTFASLVTRLRESLSAQRKLGVWQPSSGSKSFHVILVDKNVRFPPRKLITPDDPHQQQGIAHSPLSPLTPSSPLYPDGLIAPIWIRKHTTLVPSVFVLFMRLYEYQSTGSRTPLDGPDQEREQEERKRDADLASEVALRKKATSDRGIKLTVVLMASRKMLDDPTLDARLTFIRRTSGLDSRAALFVLSPVSPSELHEFVKSLQQALYEPALEYYTSHSKRVRRKRNRHSQAASGAVYSNPIASPLGAPSTRPLRPEGWTVRYEYKMACFAEFRGEDEVALKHFQDAYSTLVMMFGSTAILPPRTKRWAEAKVLADCINFKICKLFLYNNEHSLALAQHSIHMKKFGDFSRGWGIGEETYEYWSWMARQHRVFSELLEHGLRSSLTLPSHAPTPPLSALQTPAINPGPRSLEPEALRGLNPCQALQHPGFYYYIAAVCTEARRNRFLAVLENEDHLPGVTSTPGFANEKKVDHLTIILELYTKAYEHFKKSSTASSTTQGQSRQTLWIAFRIAQTYHDAGKFDMAVKFFERIAKTYRNEKWSLVLRPILLTWYACARQLGDVELSVKLLVEMLGHSRHDEEDGSLQEDLLAVLQSTVPSSDECLTVDLSEACPIFDTNVVFWHHEVKVGEPAAFQIWVTAPTDITIASLPIASLTVHFSEDLHPPIVVRHSDELCNDSPIQRVDVGGLSIRNDLESTDTKEVQAGMRWSTGNSLVLSGFVSSSTCLSFSVSKLVVNMKYNAWNIDIPLEPRNSREGTSLVNKWLCSVDPLQSIPLNDAGVNSVTFIQRPHQLLVSFEHQAPAYLDEDYPIIINVTNIDDRELGIVVDVLLQPSETDNAVNSIALGEVQSASLIKSVDLGVIPPGEQVQRTLQLTSTVAVGDRVLDISFQSRFISKEQPSTEDLTLNTMDTLRTLTVPTVSAFKVISSVEYSRSTKEKVGLVDLASFEPDFWDGGEGGDANITTTVECAGPWNIEVESMQLVRENDDHRAKIVASSGEKMAEDMFPAELVPGDVLCDLCQIKVTSELDTDEPFSVPGEYEIRWRRISDDNQRGSSTFTSRVPLPTIQPPSDGVIAVLSIPPVAKLHQAIYASLAIRNPPSGRSANVMVHVEPDASDGFIFAGMRSGRIPILLPGTEEVITWKLIAVECGEIKIPKINVVDRRKASPGDASSDGLEERAIPIVDVRFDRWSRADAEESKAEKEGTRGLAFHVTVLP